MEASAENPRRTKSSVPLPACSSFTTQSNTTSPRNATPASRKYVMAISAAAMPPFMSEVPRPYITPSDDLAAERVARPFIERFDRHSIEWPLNIRERPPPVPGIIRRHLAVHRNSRRIQPARLQRLIGGQLGVRQDQVVLPMRRVLRDRPENVGTSLRYRALRRRPLRQGRGRVLLQWAPVRALLRR